ncbi:MAG: hypothetical protein JWL71_2965 [Acidobacteria bacterium]|nr:hypothetical protein [Acidobacteriota bacterium]
MTGVRREAIVVVAAFAAATVVLTLPLAVNLKRVLPSDHSDTLLITWIIGWDADRLRHGLRGLWDAPIFFPYRGTLAFSETMLGLAILVAPVYWLTADPVLTYNLAFLLAFAIAGVGMYLLARELTGSRAAAFAAGMYYAFGPLRMSQYAHLQMVATGWIPIALFGLHRYFSTRRPRWLAVFAGGWIMQTLSNMYVGYFIAVPIAAVVLDGLWRERHGRRRLVVNLAAASLLIAAVLAPVGAGYYRARADYHQVRSIDEVVANSADLRAYIVGKNSVGAWRWLPTAVVVDPEKELFPGLFAATLAAIGMWTALADPRRRRWAVLYGSIAGMALILSLGPHLRIWGAVVTTHAPYAWLLAIVPGMDGMRVPARFVIVVIAALSVLVAFGVDWLLRRSPPALRPLLVAACAAMVVADGWAIPISTVDYSARGRPEDRSVAFWLADRAPGAVLHLPIRPSGEQLLDYQFMTLVHRHPIVNGFSGYGTPLLPFLESASSPLSDAGRFPAAVRMLRALGVRYVIVHPGDYDAASRASGDAERMIGLFRASGQIAKEAALPRVTAFELTPPDAPVERAPLTAVAPGELSIGVSESADRIANLVDGDRDTRWIGGIGGQDGSSWLRIALPRPVDVARVDLQIAERSLTDYPRVLRIDAEDAAGRLQTLYDASPYPELGAAIVRDARYPTLEIALPHNTAAALWIRQIASSRASWSIHELRLWRYDSPGGIR